MLYFLEQIRKKLQYICINFDPSKKIGSYAKWPPYILYTLQGQTNIAMKTWTMNEGCFSYWTSRI